MSNDAAQVERRLLLKNALATIERLQAKLDAAQRASQEPIAIIGMSCRFPGAVDSPEAYWSLLQNGTDAIREMPSDRFGNGNGESEANWYGGFLDQIDQFDPQFFGISPREAARMDPQQRLVLEVSWEALERAGIVAASLRGSQTGVFIGITTNDYAHFNLMSDPADLDAYAATGSALNVTAGRVAYFLGLQGPSMAVDTACSSSLVAVHLACQSLRLGESDMALAGGVNVLLRSEPFVCFSRWGMMAPDGRCKTFDARADGFVRGEGCGIVVLKRLADAIADGDPVLAVIRGSAVNQDGRSSGLTVPNGLSQQTVIRRALANANVLPADIGYIETHGTGTSLGDPIEVEAIGAALRDGRTAESHPLFLASVKTNIGHLESAAGIAGLIKVVLALQHREVPRHLHFQEPNPKIPWPNFPVEIPRTAQPWLPDGKCLAGVSSFGFSGTNAHVILAEAERPAEANMEAHRPLHLLTLSAQDRTALRQLAKRFEDHLASNSDVPLADVTFTTTQGRTHFTHRLAATGTTVSEFRESLAAFAAGIPDERLVSGSTDEHPPLAFLFTGQGSQYPNMGRHLFETEPLFRRTLEQCDEILWPHLEGSLLSVLYPASDSASELAGRIHQTEYTQPALFAIEYALARLWQSWGVMPGAVMGHSVGEYVAACVAGVFNLEEALRLIATRGRLMARLPSGGSMSALFADEAKVHAAIAGFADRVSIAAINGSSNVVISGAAGPVSEVVNRCVAIGISSQPLTVSHAFHSPLMEPVLAEFSAVAASVAFMKPQIDIISNVTGTVAGPEISTAGYWCEHIRKPVRFADGIKTMVDRGYTVFLECGPQPTLCAMGQRCVTDGTATWLPSLRPGTAESEQMLRSLGRLYTRGVNVGWQNFHGAGRRRVLLPTYPFERQRYWVEPPKHRRSTPPALHPLIDERLNSPLLQETVFVSHLAADVPAYLNDHRVFNVPLFPGTGFLELVLSAANLALQKNGLALTHVEIQEALVLPEEGERVVQVAVSSLQDGQATVRVFSRSDNRSWKQHATAIVQASALPAADVEPLGSVESRCIEEVKVSAYYQQLADIGLAYGPAFRGIQAIRRREGEALGHVKLPEGLSAREYCLHPVLLDACFQVIGTTLPDSTDSSASVYVPVAVSRLQIFRPVPTSVRCHAVLEGGREAAEVLHGSVRLFDEEKHLVALVEGIELKRFSRAGLQRATQRPFTDLLYQINWQRSPALQSPSNGLAGHWLILAGEDSVGAVLAKRLRRDGALVTVASPATFDISDPQAYAAFLEREAEKGAFQGVIHLWSLLEGDTVEQSQRLGYGSALFLTQALLRQGVAMPRILLVTKGAQSVPGDAANPVQPSQTALWGFARTLALEHPECRPVIIDIDGTADDPESAILSELTATDGEDQVVWRDGVRYVPRLSRRKPNPEALNIPPDHPYELFIPQQGVLENISVRPKLSRLPGFGEVTVAVRAAGLNFRDVLNVLGMYPGPAGALGNECAGVVTHVGPGVSNVGVGDAVVALADGTFASTITTRAEFVHVIPVGLSLVEAATLPIAFLTAYYGLHCLARIRQGDRVLIHAATGGVGLAAVQLAQKAGAVVFGTAGSPKKRALLRAMGVSHVMNSRTLDFAKEILAVTEGKGVDIVLNALAGDFIGKSFSVLGDNGRFLEIGKRDIWSQEQVEAFNPTLSYYPYDLADVARERPQLIGEMWQRLRSDFERGELRPLPVQDFPISEATKAFRFMSQARHVGKIVIVPEKAAAVVHADATYLITGGLGALGLALARGLVQRGARHLVLVGRSAPTDTSRVVLAELIAAGAEVITTPADVSEPADLQRVLSQIEANMPSLRGVIHAAGVLADGPMLNQTWEQFETVMRPKILGALNLDKFTRQRPLEFFVCFSAGAALLGSPGQCNYSAANAFMDGLAHARRVQGLPALSINWGAWADVGMAAAVDDRVKAQWQASGIDWISPHEGVELFFQLLSQSPAQVIVLPIHWGRMAQAGERKDRPFLSQLLSGHETVSFARPADDHKSILIKLEEVPANDRLDLLKTFVQEQVRRVLKLDQEKAPDDRKGLTEIGMDSLTAIELRNRLQAGVEQPLPATLAFEYPTIDALARYLAECVMALPATSQQNEDPADRLKAGKTRLAQLHRRRERGLTHSLKE